MKSKEQKRYEAEIRQEAYDELTPQQKLDKLNRGHFTATKERDKNVFPSLKDTSDIITMEDF